MGLEYLFTKENERPVIFLLQSLSYIYPFNNYIFKWFFFYLG